MHGTGTIPRRRHSTLTPVGRLFTVAEVEDAMASVEEIHEAKGRQLVDQLLAERDEAIRAAFQRGFDTATELTAGRPAAVA